MDRRSFLKTVGIAAAGAGAVGGGLEYVLNRPFDEFWKLMLEYNEVRNDFIKGTVSQEEFKKIEGRLRAVSHLDFPECPLFGHDKSDFNIARDFFEEKGKLYHKSSDEHSQIDVIHLGDIKDQWRGILEYKGDTLRYRVLVFESESKTVNEALDKPCRTAFWDNNNNTAYINRSRIRENAKKTYGWGKELEKREPAVYQEELVKEFYTRLKNKARDNHPLLYFINEEYRAFEKEFEHMVMISCEAHERMHHFYPTNVQPYLAEVAALPELNAWVFKSMPHDKDFEEFNLLFKKAGCAREDVLKFSPQTRAKIAEKILYD